MPDPMTISSIVTNTIQLVDVGLRFCREAEQIYHVGAAAGNRDVQTVTGALVRAATVLEKDLVQLPQASHGPHDQDILDIARKCADIGGSLQVRLTAVGLDGPRGKLKSLRQATKSILQKRAVTDTANVLNSYRQQLQMLTILASEKRRADDAQSLKSIIDKVLRKMQTQECNLENAFDQLARSSTAKRGLNTPADLILESLKFDGMTARLDSLDTGHKATFGWVFTPPNDIDEQGGSFSRWLRNGIGTFWISGKPGCGKSTLMKYICTHEQLSEALMEWSRGSYLLIATFFAWNAGHENQNTEHGLLRSLLYQLLSGRPDLVELVLPEQMEELRFGKSPIADAVSIKACRNALKRLAILTDETATVLFQPARICLLVDGLDEFVRDADSLAHYLQDLAEAHTGFKVVISGRQLNQFDAIFAHAPQFCLHEQTASDIRAYAENIIGSTNPDGLWSVDGQAPQSLLIDEACEKADGVFLWVKIVVRSLKSALENGDSIPELKTALDELPSELEQLYNHLFRHLQPKYRIKAAQYFRLMECFSVKQPAQAFTALSFSLAEATDMGSFLQSFDHARFLDWKRHQCSITERRVRARCGDLLEIYHGDPGGSTDDTTEPQIRYMHRTVAEYLKTEEPRSYILETVQATSFDADIHLAKSEIMRLRAELHFLVKEDGDQKVLPVISNINRGMFISNKQSRPLAGSFWNPLERVLNELRDREDWQISTDPSLLREIVAMVTSIPEHWMGSFFRVCTKAERTIIRSECNPFWFAVQAGLFRYVEYELSLRLKGDFPEGSTRPLRLVYKTMLNKRWQGSSGQRLRTAKALVRHGADLVEFARESQPALQNATSVFDGLSIEHFQCLERIQHEATVGCAEASKRQRLTIEMGQSSLVLKGSAMLS